LVWFKKNKATPATAMIATGTSANAILFMVPLTSF
jgi:hypothetical protein